MGNRQGGKTLGGQAQGGQTQGGMDTRGDGCKGGQTRSLLGLFCIFEECEKMCPQNISNGMKFVLRMPSQN